METESRRAFANALPIAWVTREGNPDYGIDVPVEIFDDTAATGRMFNTQLKATDEPDLAKALKGVRFDLETIEYYKSLPAPTLVVLYHSPSKQLYHQWLHAYDSVARGGRPPDPQARSMMLRFLESDAWADGTPVRLDAGVRGYNLFRSPALPLPIRVGVHGAGSVIDALPVTFALRNATSRIKDLVFVEHREQAPEGEVAVLLNPASSRVTLADVASFTMAYDADEGRSPTIGADLALGLAVALANVGQTNIAAQITAAVALESSAIEDLEVALPLAAAMANARRAREALELADQLDESDDEERRQAGATILMVVRMLSSLSDEDRRRAIEVTERRLDRRVARGELRRAGAEAYNIGMMYKNGRDGTPAIAAFERARVLEPRYEDRAYFHSDLAGALFETGHHAEAADEYARAVELGQVGLVEALLADALLFAGRYADAEEQFNRYLAKDRGTEDGEWRLKRSILPLLRRTAGDIQARDVDRAEALVVTVDLEDPDLVLEDARTATLEALRLDACSGEAWFRYMLIDPIWRGAEEISPEAALAAAVLLRYASGAWMWATAAAEIAEVDTLPDILQTAYRFERQAFVDTVMSGTALEPGSEQWTRRLALLEDAIARQQELDRREGFIMRFTDDDGGVEELVYGEPT